MDTRSYKKFLRESLREIKRAHNNNYLSIFAGAGVSVDSGMPKWSKLIETIKNSLEGCTDRDDFLTIVDKFYVQYKEKMYYKKIKESIPDNFEPNELHDKIVNLNIRNIVTTNWDNLFEKAINNNGRYFDIIRKDDDMGYATGYSKLIKMHGDLEEKNIIFRETDYLEYNRNFPLIENYVRAIFSTDVVVLVGYSLGDYNVKQILSWLRCSAKTKPIYFIKTEKEFEPLEFEYYKEKNIFVLYLEELCKKWEVVQDRKSLEQLSKFFEIIETTKKNQQKISAIISNDNIKKIQSMFINFDNKSIQKLIDSIKTSQNTTDEQELQKAFLLYHSQQYPETYETLKRLSKESFKHKNHKIWYISEFNRKNCDNNTKKYGQDKQRIDLDENYLKLPVDIRENIKPLITLELDLHKELLEIYRLKDNIYKTYKTLKQTSWFSIYNPDNRELFNIFDRVENDRIGLCILADYGRFYENALRTMLIILAKACLMKKIYPDISVKEVKIVDFILSYSIRYFKEDEIEYIFRDFYEKDDCLVVDKQQQLIIIFTNICSFFNDANDVIYRQWFNNFLLIVAWVKLEQSTFDVILNKFCDKLEQCLITLIEYRNIHYFIGKQYIRNKNINLKVLIRLIYIYMNQSSREQSNKRNIIAQKSNKLFIDILVSLKEQRQCLLSKEHANIVRSFIDTISLIDMAQTFDDFIMHVYDISEKALQDKISLTIKEKFETISDDDKVDANKETYLQFAKILKEKDILTQQDYDNIQNKWKKE